MAECCGAEGYDEEFSDRFARRMARRYRRRGLTRPAREIVAFLTSAGIEGASVLEIGGGVGELHVELLRRGAARATNLEIATSYEAQAQALQREAGVAGLVERRIHDIASDPGSVEPADVVVLHRVVCCYPDYERLLGAAAGKATRLLAFSHPQVNPLTRSLAWLDELPGRMKGTSFRGYLHPPEAMVAVAVRAGLQETFRASAFPWRVVGLQR